MYEIEQLLELIRDKKSPWHETVNWTRNGDMIRESYIKDSNSIDLDFIEKYFTSLRFNDLQVKYFYKIFILNSHFKLDFSIKFKID
jgi:hypothetical protein